MAALAATPAGGGVGLASVLGADSLMVAADGTPTMCGEIHTVDGYQMDHSSCLHS